MSTLVTTTRSEELVERFAPVFDEVGAEAVERERERRLPYAEVARLREAGFTRVTLPVEFGGDGATAVEFFELLAGLARRDPNLAQLLRSHFNYIDRNIHLPRTPEVERRLRFVADGAIVGNATFERAGVKLGENGTQITRDEGGYRLDGTKYYSTGTLYADLVSVLTVLDGQSVTALVRTDAPGVTRIDDWRGFGQRMTGSGTTVFENVRLEAEDIIRVEPERPSHGGAFAQLVLLATVAGIGRAIVDDASRYVRNRKRGFSHASAATPQADPLVQEVVGRLSALSYTADSALAAASAAIARSSAAILSEAGEDEVGTRAAQANIAATRAQLVILPAVLEAATELFEVGGASSTDESLALDRHWRNARTIATHNPLAYKARDVGDLLINDTPIATWWTVGES